MVNRFTQGLVTIALAGLAGGCYATTAMAPPAVNAQAHSLTPTPDRGIVYVYRSESFGGAVKMPVLMDGVYSGETVPHAFMVWEMAPGRHLVTSKAENDEQLEIDVRPGQAYFVWQEVKMGMMMARSRLHVVSEPEGRQALARCKLVSMPQDARSFNVGRPVAFAAPVPAAF
jgi:Protein of unknown function (DUF2846)